jgi:hypothetical protein
LNESVMSVSAGLGGPLVTNTGFAAETGALIMGAEIVGPEGGC